MADHAEMLRTDCSNGTQIHEVASVALPPLPSPHIIYEPDAAWGGVDQAFPAGI